MVTIIENYHIGGKVDEAVEFQDYPNPSNYISKQSYTKSEDTAAINEIAALKKQLCELQLKNSMMEADKEELVNQVSDLRLLLKKVAKENQSLTSTLEKQEVNLQRRVEGLESTLQSAYENSSHFEQLKTFWADM